jgi:hypothetical protein
MEGTDYWQEKKDWEGVQGCDQPMITAKICGQESGLSKCRCLCPNYAKASTCNFKIISRVISRIPIKMGKGEGDG